ncbi:MAG: UbiA family prenyltransferase [Anaerolineaceae bacterium]|nr:UbiA family prenyltransferase [Anaerolineaceae bacterium]
MSKTKVWALFRLFRIELPFAAGISVLMGELLALGHFPTAREMALGFLSVFFISAAALIINDYFDLEIDKINAPERSLAAGLVTEREVIGLFTAVTLLGLILSSLISLTALLVAVLVWAVGFLYNWRFKKTGLLGNLMVSFSVGMTFVFGGITVGQPWARMVWFFAVIGMLIDLGEEIAADALDVAGDRQIGSSSLAIVLGQETAMKISASVFLLLVVLSLVPFWLGWLALVYLFPLLLIDAVILYATAKLLDSKTAAPRTYIRLIYFSGLAGMIIFLLIRLFLGDV